MTDEHTHDDEQIDVLPWDQARPDLRNRFHTVVYKCAECGRKRWAKERRNAALREFS